MMVLHHIRNYIDGQVARLANRRTFEDVNPAIGQVFALVDEAGEDDVDAAVTAAHGR